MKEGDAEDAGTSAAGMFGDLERFRLPLTRFFSRRLNDPSETADLVQDVFLRIVKKGPLAHADNVDGYVFRTAESVWLDRGRHRRSRKTDYHDEFDPASHAGLELGADRIVSARQELRMLTDALSELPERTQAVFLLRRVDGCAMSEIADRLGVSLSTAEKQMRTAVLHLLTRGRASR